MYKSKEGIHKITFPDYMFRFYLVPGQDYMFRTTSSYINKYTFVAVSWSDKIKSLFLNFLLVFKNVLSVFSLFSLYKKENKWKQRSNHHQSVTLLLLSPLSRLIKSHSRIFVSLFSNPFIANQNPNACVGSFPCIMDPSFPTNGRSCLLKLVHQRQWVPYVNPSSWSQHPVHLHHNVRYVAPVGPQHQTQFITPLSLV